MLKSGHPPEGWDELLKAAKDKTLSLSEPLVFPQENSFYRHSDYLYAGTIL
jgi:hypothetical protein